ncbi:MAG: ABC transporter permease [Halioglobus sp.]|jgi:putative ABC transport system permease protein
MIWNTIQLAVREIRRNLLRSSLTMLGIIIGVSAVIVMVLLGRGATAQVTSSIASLGSNLLYLRPGEAFHGPGGVRGTADPFDAADVAAIDHEVAHLAAVAPVVMQTMLAVYGNDNWNTSVTGTNNDFFRVREWPVSAGRIFSETELRTGKPVCVVGSTVLDELFSGEDPIGAAVRLGKISCQVIGVLEEKGQSTFGSDQDDVIVMPIRTFQRRIAGNTDIATVYISVDAGDHITKAKEDIEALMRQRRHIVENQKDDFYVRDMQEIVERVTSTTEVLTALLGAVAAVSLLVGGIGIMNIMLVSVTERTREIGIRLAIGAMERDVLRQFLVEAVVLAVFGGSLGILVGLLGSVAVASLIGIPFVLDPWIILIAFSFSCAVGVIFGYFPARKAARLDPIEALRHE